uniref:ZP domain-containing protein n=1 Tax=Loa loa TaxID=7209 RepID=A0A1I7VC53_LOALO
MLTLTDSDQDNGCVVDFKVSVDDDTSQCRTRQIHVQANCPDFVPSHLYINGAKFSSKL